MRSDLVFGALDQVKNQYFLCRLASEATRKLHKPTDRLQDTINDVLNCLKRESPTQLRRRHQAARNPTWGRIIGCSLMIAGLILVAKF